MSLQIFLLGQFKLQADNLPLELPSRPAQSLLAYLALNAGVTYRREKLAGLLWPEATETNARRYLRQALWRIRKTLESGSLAWEDYLQINDIDVTFDDRSGYWLDVEFLLKRAEAWPVEEIIEIVRFYRGELLPGFYEEWVTLERDRLQAAYQQKMNLLLDGLIRTQKWDDVLKWGEQWIRLGHSPEPAYRALMHAYAGLGDQRMACATYERCVEMLNRELAVEPSAETQRLYEQVCRGELAGLDLSIHHSTNLAIRQPSFLDEVEPNLIEPPIFVACEGELDQLHSFLSLALAGQGRVVFVIGEAGSGKTALMNEFTRRAQETHADLIVASGNCNAHTGIGDPYLPFREILELLTGDVEAQWAAGAITREHVRRLWRTLPLTTQALLEAGTGLINTFVPGSALVDRASACIPGRTDWLAHLAELAGYKLPPGPSVHSLQQSDLFEQVTKVLQLLAQRAPLLLVIDDLQWADPGSISLLFHLGRRLAGCRILIFGAYRPEEVASGRDGKRHPLESVVNELQRLFGDIMVNVGQIKNRDFVEAVLDSEPNHLGPSFRQMLHRQTGSHPLFTIELLRGMQERGDLVRDQDGQWVEGMSLDWETLPARVEAVIAERIDRLSRPLQAALRVACVEGKTFTAEVVARIQASDEREMLVQLSGELDKRHHLISAQSIARVDKQLLSRYRFRHILFQKYLYNSLDEVERVHLHEQVGTALETLYSAQEETAAIAPQLARHFLEARITDKAIHYLHQAGDRAVQMSAYREGMAHLNKGLELLMTLPDSPERARQELELQLSLGLAWMGDMPSPEWRNIYTRARELCQQTGNLSQLCLVSGELSILHYVRAEYEEARTLAEEALNLAQQGEELLLTLLSHWHLGFILFGSGEFIDARDHLNQIIAFYEPQHHHDAFLILRGSDAGASALAYDACCLWCLGYPEQALQRSRESLALARTQGHAFSMADVLCFAGCMLNSMRRNVPPLKDNAQDLMRLSQEIGFLTWLGVGTCYWGEALARLGQVQEGTARIHEGLAIRQSRASRCNMSGILGALAEALAMGGDPEEGLATLAEAFAFVEKTGEHYCEAELYRLQGELRLMQADEVTAEASFHKAMAVARRQQARSWELRAAISLGRLWQRQGKVDEAHWLLGPIYEWFTEGFDTPDLKEAQALLEVRNV